jgi:hypothetical protein
MLYRAFPFLADAGLHEAGGPLYVPRERQGTGRHDQPDQYGALYVSRSPESAVAERIQAFRGQSLTDADLGFTSGAKLALATFEDATIEDIIDLDDPAELVARGLRPSTVATRDRAVTRAMALRIFAEGVTGFAWWSTLEASWTNVTLFAERAAPQLELARNLELLSIEHPVLTAAAAALGVNLAR